MRHIDTRCNKMYWKITYYSTQTDLLCVRTGDCIFMNVMSATVERLLYMSSMHGSG